MELAVLGPAPDWHFHDLCRAAAARHRVEAVDFRRLRSCVAADGIVLAGGARSLADFDALLVRSMPRGSLEQIIFRMDSLARAEAAGVAVVNPPRAVEAAVDKYLATAKLRAAGLRVPRTFVCQQVDDALSAFEALGGTAVVKPIFGSLGRGIARLDDPALAERAFHMLAGMEAVIYLQEYVPHEGCDVRVLVIGERLLAMRRRNPDDWRTNVSRGAAAEPCTPTDEIAHLAREAARAVGASLVGVDLLPARSGQIYVLEVNAVPGWRALSQALDVDVAALVLAHLEQVAAGGHAA